MVCESGCQLQWHAEEGMRSTQPHKRSWESKPSCRRKWSFLAIENPIKWSGMFSSILTIMRKGHPGWEGVIFFKDLNSHYSLFCDWQGRKRTRTLCLHPVSFLHWRCLCVSSPLQNFCYFLNIQNHRWQRTAIKDNPLSLAFHFVVCNSVRRGFFFFFFSSPFLLWWQSVMKG